MSLLQQSAALMANYLKEDQKQIGYENWGNFELFQFWKQKGLMYFLNITIYEESILHFIRKIFVASMTSYYLEIYEKLLINHQ